MAEGTGRAHTATIKFGKGYDAPWLVLGGDSLEELRRDIIESFGLDSVSVAEHDLSHLIVTASTSAQSIFNTTSGLGGAIVKVERKGSPAAQSAFAAARGSEQPAAASGPPWHEDKPAEPEKDPLVVAFEEVANLDAFKTLVTGNQAQLTRPEIQAAAKAAKARLS